MMTTELQKQIATSDESPASSFVGGTQFVESHFVYLDIKIVEVVSNNLSNWNPSIEQEPLQMLKLGGTYAIEISYSNFPGYYHQQNSLSSGSKSSFRLICSTIQFDKDFIMETSSKKLKLVVPQNGPTCDVVFVISYCEEMGEEIGQIHKIATSLKIKLMGNYNLDDPKFINITQIDTASATQTAILYIAADMNKIKMTGWSRRGEMLQTDSMDWGERKTLAEAIKLQKKPKNIRSEMRRFSRTKAGNLIKWVKNLLTEYGEHFCLFVVDHTNLETPWEMLELNDNEYLGVKTVIVRWMNINIFNRSRVLKPQDVPKQEDPRQGRVLFYLDETLGSKQVYHEKEVLNRLCVKNCNKLKEMENHLELLNSKSDIGLIYLGCHAYEGEIIGSHQNILTYLDLEMIPEVLEPRPIVFVNACESACLKRDGDYFSGLPETFLARIACGYIGTLGQVGSRYASEVAKHLLQEAHDNAEGIRVAELLRVLREKIVKELLNCENEEERMNKQIEFIYAFMYVYYGDSQARLRLRSSEMTEVQG